MCCQICLQIGILKGKIKQLASEDIKEVGNFFLKFGTLKKVYLTEFL